MNETITKYVNASAVEKRKLLDEICTDKESARLSALKLIDMPRIKYITSGYEILIKTAEEKDLDTFAEKFEEEKNDSVKAIILKASVELINSILLSENQKNKMVEFYKKYLNSEDVFISGYAAKGYEALKGAEALDDIYKLYLRKELWLNQMLIDIFTKYVENANPKKLEPLFAGFGESKYKARYLLKLIPALKVAVPLTLSQNLYDKIIDAYKHIDINSVEEDDFFTITKLIADISAEDTSEFTKRIFILRGVSVSDKHKTLFTAILEKSKQVPFKKNGNGNFFRKEASRP
jgi:hypothetical protein